MRKKRNQIGTCFWESWCEKRLLFSICGNQPFYSLGKFGISRYWNSMMWIRPFRISQRHNFKFTILLWSSDYYRRTTVQRISDGNSVGHGGWKEPVGELRDSIRFLLLSTHFLVCECYRLCIAKIYPEGIYPSFISQLQQRTRIIRHSRPSHRQNQYYLMTIWESGHHSWLILTYQQIPKNNYKVLIQAFGIDCTYWCSQISLIRIDGSNIATLSLRPPNVTNFRHRHGGTYIAQYHAGETYDDHPRTSLGGRTSTNGFRPEWQTTYLIGDPDPCFAYFASDFQGIPIAANDLLIINLFIRHHISTT